MKNFLIVLMSAASLLAYSQNISTSKEYKKVFRTYGFSDPDPVAKVGPIYPYYRFDGYTSVPTDKEWKVVELENDFIKVMILPEIGGKIWGAWEKSSGRPFLYYNQVVKFRDVAMRGPWTSGGIEANYGIIGHTPNCATPVDYLTQKKDDGSVSCYIGTLDLLTQTYWTIEINLPKDKAYFTTRSFWHNATNLDQPYYTWMNTAIKAAGNLEFIYPGTRYLGHEGEYAEWKINKDNGKDISFYEQNNFGGYKSYHIFGKYTDFFGAYWHRDHLGMARYSPHDEKAGKKIWIWGLSPQGMIWDKLLSDTDGQYVEVQSGRLFNQASPGSTFTPFKHTGFTPSTTDTWTEYWFPVMKTGGFVKANDFGALNIRSRNGYLRIDFSGLQDIKESLQLFEGDRLLYTKEIALKPLSVFTDSIAFTGDTNNVTVMLGTHKMQYHTDPNHNVLLRPIDSPRDFDWTTAYGLYLQGKEDLHQRFYVAAEEKLRKCLEKDPNYLPALSAMSMLMFRNMEYEKALGYARHALSIDTYDPASNYYYGQINVQLGNVTDAKDGFDIAALSTEYRGASFIGLSKIYFSEGDVKNTIAYARKALEVNTNNTEAEQIIATAHRIIGEKDNAIASLTRLNNLNPLNHFIRFEQYRWKPSDETAADFKSLIRNELSTETYLQLAEWYYSLGQVNESLAVLLLAPENPEVYYWIGFLKTKLKEADASTFVEKANALSANLIFPFRQSSVNVLQWAIENSQSWKPKYYLGLIYWSRNNLTQAKELFSKCGNPEYPAFYPARAALFSDENYSNDLRRAAELNPREWRYGKLLVNRLIEEKKYEEALATAKDYNKRFPTDFRISMLLAKGLLMTKQYKACSDLLEKTNILPYEGATDGRQLYREAWLMQAVDQLKRGKFRDATASINKSRQWPERLGVGKPYDSDIDDRPEKYVEALVIEKSKGSAYSEASWKKVVAYQPGVDNPNTLITALAHRNLGHPEEGERLLNEWAKKQPDDKVAQWCRDAYSGNVAPIPGELSNYDLLRLVKEIVSIP
jgi:tetratricopeptide (TPR) repeat protein